MNKIIFHGEILYSEVRHKRIVILDKVSGRWSIDDNVYCPKSLNANLTFHLAPDVAFENSSIFLKGNVEKNTTINVEGYKLECGEYGYSSRYGTKIRSEYVISTISVGKKIQIANTRIGSINSC